MSRSATASRSSSWKGWCEPGGKSIHAVLARRVEAAVGMSEPEESPYLTVRDAARYLHLNEKKIYALIQEGRIPATRATGKWLFPRRLLDNWLIETSHGGVLADRLVICGADDALLRNAVALAAIELGDEGLMSYSPCTTRLGLSQLARRRTTVAAIHWGAAREAPASHAALLREYAGHEEWVIVQIGLRDQGIVLAPSLALPSEAGELVGPGTRWLQRPQGSGARRFVERSLPGSQSVASVGIAPSEDDAALRIRLGEADCAAGSRAVANEYGLGFLPLGVVAVDLVMPRGVYFRSLFGRLVASLGSQQAREHARRLGGYDLSPLGAIRLAPAGSTQAQARSSSRSG